VGARGIDEGTPALARALARLLGARGVLLLAQSSTRGWQPLAWARRLEEGEIIASLIAEDGAEPISGAIAVSAGMPLLSEEWDEEQAALCAQAALRAQDEALTGATSTSNPVEAAPLDSSNRVSDIVPERDGAWISEGPSLLMRLASQGAQDAEEMEDSALVLAWIESDDGVLSDEWRPLWSACASQAAAWWQNARRYEVMGRSYSDLAHLAARVVDARDPRREGHGALVAHANVLMAEALGLSARETQEWEVAGLMHAVGRVAIPDALLSKEGPLEPEEREVIRDAMQNGAQWLGDVEGWSTVARLVKHAGERWDGHGYPDELEGEAIPLGSRALAISLRFASLSGGRADRDPLGSLHNVASALEVESGRALDPRLVALFLSTLRRDVKLPA
jgi:HD-GYP domain-containing protein (c-di-GMP phosphodiesterase class II)